MLTIPILTVLSKRQEEIFQAACDGVPDKIIAAELGVSPQTLFTLTFHSISRGDIVITDVTYDGVHFGDYPLLADPQNLFQQSVQQILGIQTH